MKSNYLIITTEGQEVFRYDIVDSRVTIGRDNNNTIIIPDSTVSRRHCRLELLDGIATLYDCGAKNGVLVNGVQQKQSRLFHGDHIKIGNSTLTIEIIGNVQFAASEEKTIEFDTLGHCIFPDEHTQERIVFADAVKGDETLMPMLVPRSKDQQQSFFSSLECREFIKEKKIYLLAVLLFCTGGGLFLIGNGPRSLQMNAPVTTPTQVVENKIAGKQKATVNSPAKSGANTPGKKVTTKTKNEATEMAREADSLDTLGRHVQAVALYRQALKLDPDNDFARTHLAILNKKIERLAMNYFNNGMQAYKMFEYETAINQWENVLYLLDNNKNHKLYSKTVGFLVQAKSELHQ